MSKKILIVTEYFYPEEFKINEVALAWKEKGYDVDVLTQNPTYPIGKVYSKYINSWYSTELWNGINIYRVKAVTGYKESLFKKLLKYFMFMIVGSIVSLKIGKKYDYVFAYDVGALTGMVPAAVLKQFYNKPVTMWVQDIWPDSVYAYGFKKTKILEFFLNKFVKYVYRNTSGFAISSKGFESKILPYLEEEKEIVYAPNWADELNKELEAYSFSDEKKLHFTFAGNIGKMQNIDNVIKGFASVEEKYREQIQLNIVGDGSHLESLQNLAKELQLNNVIFHGKKPREKMYRYFQASDFLIVSLIDKEIFALTVPGKTQTYIAARKPIIAIIEGEAANLIEENGLGFVAKPNDIEGIKNVFEEAISTTTEELEAFIEKSDLLSDTVFNKEHIVNNLLELLMKAEK